MSEPIRVLLLGTGRMGSEITRVLARKVGVRVVAAFGRRRERAGLDLGEAARLGASLDVAIEPSLDACIRSGEPDVAIQATCSDLQGAWAEIEVLLRAGVDVISIAEEMAYPACRSPAIANAMHELALAHDASIVGTGINPGFVLDFLIITLTGVCAAVERIAATRCNDLSSYGPTVLRAQGVGTSPAEFDRGVEDGSIQGHIGFPQSMQMIARALGWRIDRVEETRTPIVSSVPRETPFARVAAGQVAGCLHEAVAYTGDVPRITLTHPQQIRPELENVATMDRIEIEGSPPVSIETHPEIAGAAGTAAIAVNMIPRVLSAAPGLYTMAELPPPAALHGDVRRQVQRPRAHGDG